MRRCLTTRLWAASLRARRSSGVVVGYSSRHGLWSCGRRLVLLRRGCRALARCPFLVEIDPPLALFVLRELQLCPERAPGAAAEAGDLLLRATDRRLIAALHRLLQAVDQLLHDRRRQRLAGLVLPDHEAAAR